MTLRLLITKKMKILNIPWQLKKRAQRLHLHALDRERIPHALPCGQSAVGTLIFWKVRLQWEQALFP